MNEYKITGTPIVYNRSTTLIEDTDFRMEEVILPGAASGALLRAEQVLLWNHDAAQPMAACSNRTMTVKEDSAGVHIDADVSGTKWGREGYEAIKSGVVSRMSFGFYLKDDGYTVERFVDNGKRILKRTIKKIDRIIDFSPVTYPAYSSTSVSARAAGAAGTVPDIEKAEGLQRRYTNAPRIESARAVEPYQTRSKPIDVVIAEIQAIKPTKGRQQPQGLQQRKPRPYTLCDDIIKARKQFEEGIKSMAPLNHPMLTTDWSRVREYPLPKTFI